MNDLFCISCMKGFSLSQCRIQLGNIELWSLPHCAILTMDLNHEDTVAWRPADGKYLLKYYQGSCCFFTLDLLEHLMHGVYVLILYRFQSVRTKALRLLCRGILHHLLGIVQLWCCMGDLFSSIWLDNSCLFDGRVLYLIAFVQSVTHC